MDDLKTKQLLKKLVDEIQDLRANVDLLAAHKALKMSLEDAKEGKSVTIALNRELYEKLRKEIDAL